MPSWGSGTPRGRGALLAAAPAGRRRGPWPRAAAGQAGDAGWTRGWREEAAAAAAARLRLEAPDKSPLDLDSLPPPSRPAALSGAVGAQASRLRAAARAAAGAAGRAAAPLADLAAALLRSAWEHEEVVGLRTRLALLARRAAPTGRDFVAAGVGAGAVAGALAELGQGAAFQQAALELGDRCSRTLAAGTQPLTDAARRACRSACEAAGAALFLVVAPPAMCAELLLDAWESQELRHIRRELTELLRYAAPTKRDIVATSLGLGIAVWMLDIRGGGGHGHAAARREAAADSFVVDNDVSGVPNALRHKDSFGGYILLAMFAGCGIFLAAFHCWITSQDAR
ncbi:unnamed protein product [Prorocentrum cordatum]|uniref:Uncharacterized protein n=1 Tax=Prorocentrum cordatum TaxID=2364126 RepID=A0ABN9SFB1_9DINO|nr:unnamed protein product [Polarella glacialis]